VSFEDADPELWLTGLVVAPVRVRRATTIVDLDLTVRKAGDALDATLTYAADRFHATMVARLARHFRILLEAIAADPDRAIHALPMLGRAERARILEVGAHTASGGRERACVPERFAAQVARSADAIAVRSDGGELTYGELERRADVLAGVLRARGVGPGVVVGICFERSIEAIVAVLAVLRSGGAYLPLDPRYPADRLLYMVRDARAPIVVTRRDLAATFGEAPVEVLCFEDVGGAAASTASPVGPDDLAYVMYTSGSTGEPKGAEITHAALANFVSWAAESYGLGPNDRVLQYASIGFDTSVEEIFPALTRGATLVLRSGAVIESVPAFLELCERSGITVLDLPTAYWHELTAHLAAERTDLPPTIRLCIIGGEAAQPERVTEWRKATGGRVRLINTYGPTEATVVSTAYD
ncbi:MAG: AMP-binding protein, partial [Candidatus Binatia bacterium]